MNDDYISRRTAVNAVHNVPKGNWSNARYAHELQAVPTADVAPVVHGEVVFRNRHRKSFKRYTGFDDMGEEHTITVREESEGKEPYCGVCGCQLAESSLNYCPGCGAKMDGGEQDD